MRPWPGNTTYTPEAYGCSVSTSYLGDLTDTDRSIVVRDQGVLKLANRGILWKNTFYAPTEEIPAIASTMTFRNGGTLKLTQTATPNSFGPLVFDDGNFEYAGGRAGIEDMIGGYGRVTITGSVVKTWSTCDLGNWYLFNEDAQGNNITIFDVADITGSSAYDFDFGLHLSQPRASVGTGAYGFDKVGVGTMRLTGDNRWLIYRPKGAEKFVYYGFNGVARVKAGCLQVDGNFASNRFAVVSGAFLSGTGTVGRVEFASGAGFSPRVGQEKPLKILGDLTLGSATCLNVLVDPADVGAWESIDFAEVGGKIVSDAADPFANWTITVNGKPTAAIIQIVYDPAKKILRCKRRRGMVMIVRL